MIVNVILQSKNVAGHYIVKFSQPSLVPQNVSCFLPVQWSCSGTLPCSTTQQRKASKNTQTRLNTVACNSLGRNRSWNKHLKWWNSRWYEVRQGRYSARWICQKAKTKSNALVDLPVAKLEASFSYSTSSNCNMTPLPLRSLDPISHATRIECVKNSKQQNHCESWIMIKIQLP